MNLSLDYYVQALQERASQDNLRSLRASRPLPYGQIELSGKELVNFASNDYLGLSQDLTLIARANEYAQRYGVGSGSSRLLSGNLQVFEKIENKLARLKGTEAALILPTGFQANSSVIPAIVDKKSVARQIGLFIEVWLRGFYSVLHVGSVLPTMIFVTWKNA